jgi:hypothetical protein
MRPQRSIFLAAIVAASLVAAGCANSKKDVQAAKKSLYDTDFSVVYGAALEATRDVYPNLEDAPGRGAIKTAWHQVSYANNQDDLSNQQVVANNPGAATSSGQASAGLPTRLAYKRYFIRFDVSINGGRPWRLKVVGHAAEWEPGAAQPSELHGVARPSWLEARTDSLLTAIHNKLKSYAVPLKEGQGGAENDDGAKKTDPTSFKDVPAEAGKRLAVLKDVLGGRDYGVLRAQLADDVVWSLGGGTGADVAIATWQADPESLDQMAKAIAAGCGGDAKRVTCPAGPPAAGTYQLTLEPRGDGWRVTSFVRAE